MELNFNNNFFRMISKDGIVKDTGVVILNSEEAINNAILSWKKLGFNGIPVMYQDSYDKHNCILNGFNGIYPNEYIGYCNSFTDNDVTINFINEKYYKDTLSIKYANFVFQVLNDITDMKYHATSVYYILLDRNLNKLEE